MTQDLNQAEQLLNWICDQPSLPLSIKKNWLQALNQQPVDEAKVLALTQNIFDTLALQQKMFLPSDFTANTLASAIKFEDSAFSLTEKIITEANQNLEASCISLKNRYKNSEQNTAARQESTEQDQDQSQITALKESLGI